MKSGILYGVSVGPGDPDLLTLKAVHILSSCPVIAAPETKGENTVALNIVSHVVDLTAKQVIRLPFLMTKDPVALERSHQEVAALIRGYLDQGMDVAMPNLGDVSIYSTFSYIMDILTAEGYLAEMVPGVPSFCAIAAKLGVSLTSKLGPLHIVPAGYGQIEEELRLPGTKVIMKSGKTLRRLTEQLQEAGLLQSSAMVTNCGLPGENIITDMTAVENEAGYFSTIVVRES